jgi:predicted transcriptional regulator
VFEREREKRERERVVLEIKWKEKGEIFYIFFFCNIGYKLFRFYKNSCNFSKIILERYGLND